MTAAASAIRGSSWARRVGFAPGPTTESLRDSITSGRITALAIDPNCGAGSGCRVWVAAAGGGIWRTTNGLDPQPTWHAVTAGLPTNALGSLVVDPNDASGNTLYAGTGEANAINQAGLGVYKSTDGGNSWSLVPGSFDVAKDRSVGAIAIDPTDPEDDLDRHRSRRPGPVVDQRRRGGAARRPDARRLSLDRRRPALQPAVQPARRGPARSTLGGVTNLQLDPADHTTVYASLFGYGIWRSSASLEGGDAGWKQIFKAAQQGSPPRGSSAPSTR